MGNCSSTPRPKMNLRSFIAANPSSDGYGDEWYFDTMNGLLDRWAYSHVQFLRKRFQEATGGKGEKELDKKGFFKLFAELQEMPKAVAESAFRMFDTDNSGRLNFREFCCALALCCHLMSSTDEKIRFVFDMFDTNDDGLLSANDLQLLLEAAFQRTPGVSNNGEVDERDVAKKQQEIMELKEELLGSGGQHLTFERFQGWAQNNLESLNNLLHTFQIVPSPERERAIMEEILSRHKTLQDGSTWYCISHKWLQVWKAHAGWTGPSPGRRVQGSLGGGHSSSSSSSSAGALALPMVGVQHSSSLVGSQLSGSHSMGPSIGGAGDLAAYTQGHTPSSSSSSPPPHSHASAGSAGFGRNPSGAVLGTTSSISGNNNNKGIGSAVAVTASLSDGMGARDSAGRRIDMALLGEEEGTDEVMAIMREIGMGHGGHGHHHHISGGRPPEIDNTDLEGEHKGELKMNLVEHLDYELIPEEMWHKLMEWYGGGPAILRKVICMGEDQQPQVELYPPLVLVVVAGENGQLLPQFSRRFFISRQSSLAEVLQMLADKLNKTAERSRLWHRVKGEQWRVVSSMSMTLEEFLEGKVWDAGAFLLETQRSTGEWPRDTLGTPHQHQQSDASGDEAWPPALLSERDLQRHFEVGDRVEAQSGITGEWMRGTIVDVILRDQRSAPKEVKVHYDSTVYKCDEWISTVSERLAPLDTHTSATAASSTAPGSGGGTELSAPPIRGATGMNNLGNTCFLNSTIQCLANTPLMKEYFLSSQYLKDINDRGTNCKGRLAEEFGSVVQELWAGKTAALTARNLKRTIDQFAPHFAGYEQHDAQELLAFFLDGLHEDLNRALPLAIASRSGRDAGANTPKLFNRSKPRSATLTLTPTTPKRGRPAWKDTKASELSNGNSSSSTTANAGTASNNNYSSGNNTAINNSASVNGGVGPAASSPSGTDCSASEPPDFHHGDPVAASADLTTSATAAAAAAVAFSSLDSLGRQGGALGGVTSSHGVQLAAGSSGFSGSTSDADGFTMRSLEATAAEAASLGGDEAPEADADKNSITGSGNHYINSNSNNLGDNDNSNGHITSSNTPTATPTSANGGGNTGNGNTSRWWSFAWRRGRGALDLPKDGEHWNQHGSRPRPASSPGNSPPPTATMELGDLGGETWQAGGAAAAAAAAGGGGGGGVDAAEFISGSAPAGSEWTTSEANRPPPGVIASGRGTDIEVLSAEVALASAGGTSVSSSTIPIAGAGAGVVVPPAPSPEGSCSTANNSPAPTASPSPSSSGQDPNHTDPISGNNNNNTNDPNSSSSNSASHGANAGVRPNSMSNCVSELSSTTADGWREANGLLEELRQSQSQSQSHHRPAAAGTAASAVAAAAAARSDASEDGMSSATFNESEDFVPELLTPSRGTGRRSLSLLNLSFRKKTQDSSAGASVAAMATPLALGSPKRRPKTPPTMMPLQEDINEERSPAFGEPSPTPSLPAEGPSQQQQQQPQSSPTEGSGSGGGSATGVAATLPRSFLPWRGRRPILQGSTNSGTAGAAATEQPSASRSREESLEQPLVEERLAATPTTTATTTDSSARGRPSALPTAGRWLKPSSSSNSSSSKGKSPTDKQSPWPPASAAAAAGGGGGGGGAPSASPQSSANGGDVNESRDEQEECTEDEDNEKDKEREGEKEVDEDKLPDEEKAARQWDRYRTKNRSLIVDVFEGQLRSQLTCCKCGTSSSTFEPFRSLSLPIPFNHVDRVTLKVVLFRLPYSNHMKLEERQQLVRYSVTVPKSAMVERVERSLSNLLPVPMSSILLAEVYRSRIHRYLDPNLALSDVRAEDQLLAYEIMQSAHDLVEYQEKQAPQKARKDKMPEDISKPPQTRVLLIQAMHRRIVDVCRSDGRTWMQRREVFGLPFVMSAASSWTYATLHDMLMLHAKRFLKPSKRDSPSKSRSFLFTSTDTADDGSSEQRQVPFVARIVNASGTACGACDRRNCSGCLLPKGNARLRLRAGLLTGAVSTAKIYLALDWVDSSTYDQEYIDSFIDDPSVSQGAGKWNDQDESFGTLQQQQRHRTTVVDGANSENSGQGNGPPAGAVPLSACIDAFAEPEEMRVEHGNGVKCETCNENVDAVKKLEIWREPDVLVLHIKRFHFTGVHYEKLNTPVDIPTSELNLRPWIVSPSGVHSAPYELYGIVCHFGGMSGGHYTSYCVNHEGQEPVWLKFNDDQVTSVSIKKELDDDVSRQGYVLFYRKRAFSSSNLINYSSLL